jgi:hypothetical protein
MTVKDPRVDELAEIVERLIELLERAPCGKISLLGGVPVAVPRELRRRLSKLKDQ